MWPAEGKGECQTVTPLVVSESLSISFGCLVTCYYALEHCCCATHSCHCKDPYVGGFFCFQGGPGTRDCHGYYLLLALAQQGHSSVLVGCGCEIAKEKNDEIR